MLVPVSKIWKREDNYNCKGERIIMAQNVKTEKCFLY